ncbi:MAG: PspC domain-containing protein [Allosphingosinicella sp.]
MSLPPSIFARDDTMFGVCEALAEDFGIPSNLLRIALALALFWSPFAAAAAYVGAGLLVAAVRWCVPDPRRSVEEAAAEAAAPTPAEWPDFAEAA